MFKPVFICIFVLLFSSVSLAQQAIRPWLGVMIEEGKQGVAVKGTLPETPAQKAGILIGDEILKIDSKEVKLPQELIQEVVNRGIGYEVKVELLRNGKKITKKLKLVAKPGALDIAKKAILNKEVPAFEAKVIKGTDAKTFSQKNLIGKVTILEFWATWCPACVGSYPRLIEFSKKNASEVQVVTVTGEEVAIVKKFLAKAGSKTSGLKDAPLIYLHSSDDTLDSKLFVSAIPMFILVGRDGKVVDMAIGGGSFLDEILDHAKKIANE